MRKIVVSSNGHFVRSADLLVEMMGMLGFSDRAIRKHLGFTSRQIQLRLKKAGIKRIDYRDCLSPLSKQVVYRLDALSERKLIEHIEQHLLK